MRKFAKLHQNSLNFFLTRVWAIPMFYNKSKQSLMQVGYRNIKNKKDRLLLYNLGNLLLVKMKKEQEEEKGKLKRRELNKISGKIKSCKSRIWTKIQFE